ncbi:hypothetical protein [Streptomyces ipomoeae]|uniref:hypothetical protein n=1 Tax=Streptomyces ipomoeae TaxID=103232 RepID=UPI0011463A7E|nr:hypothetical protein [Streptomyces ipomoeae]TQE33159.1 hypothetical protein Sipo7851_21955 [Streptomyces ipomoeae]
MAALYPTAREIPEVRAELAAWAADLGRDGMANWLHCMLSAEARTSYDDLLPPGVTTPRALAVRTAAGLRAAELVYVTSDMTALAHHAAESLTDYEMRPEDLPAPVGMLAFEDPPMRYQATGNQPVRLVTWGPWLGHLAIDYWSGTREYLDQVDAALPTLDLDPAESEAWLRAKFAHVAPGQMANIHPTHGFTYHRTTLIEPGTPDLSGTSEADIALLRLIQATWLLMGQTIATSEHAAADRASRRRIQRIDRDYGTDVRIIRLRRARTERGTDPAESSGTREYQHRWVVRGHWKQQWYPSRGAHRPIWISPYIAGPDGLPLLGGEKVFALAR